MNFSYSFELNPDWSKSFSPQPEILQYLEKVANKYGISNQIEYGKRVLKAEWIGSENKWNIELDNGEVCNSHLDPSVYYKSLWCTLLCKFCYNLNSYKWFTKSKNIISFYIFLFLQQTFKANAIIDGTGPLHVPSTPDFKGKDLFKGEAFHSARWQKDYDPTGKRIAVIGTGASAVQIVPNIASKVLFQFKCSIEIYPLAKIFFIKSFSSRNYIPEITLLVHINFYYTKF